MNRFFVRILILFIAFAFVSCTKKSDDAVKIRIVNLQGEPAAVQIKSLDSNLEAIKQQEQIKESKNFASKSSMGSGGKFQPASSINNRDSELREVSLGQRQPESDYTKIANENNFVSESNSSLLNKNDQLNSQDIQEKEQKSNTIYVFNDGKKTASEEVLTKQVDSRDTQDDSQGSIEIDLSKEEKKDSNIAKVAKKTPVAKGGQKLYYVQVGSYSNVENANSRLNKMSSFHKGLVKEFTINEVVTNRVLLGPFTKKSKALKLMNKIKNSGEDAVIIKDNN